MTDEVTTEAPAAQTGESQVKKDLSAMPAEVTEHAWFKALKKVLGDPVRGPTTQPKTLADYLSMWTDGPLPRVASVLQEKLAKAMAGYGDVFPETKTPIGDATTITLDAFALVSSPDDISPVDAFIAVTSETRYACSSSRMHHGIAFCMDDKDFVAEAKHGAGLLHKNLDEVVRCIKDILVQEAQTSIMRAAKNAAPPLEAEPKLIKAMGQFGILNKRGPKGLDHNDEADRAMTSDETWKLVSRKRGGELLIRGDGAKRRKLERLGPGVFNKLGKTVYGPAVRTAVVGEFYFVPKGSTTLTLPTMYGQRGTLTLTDMQERSQFKPLEVKYGEGGGNLVLRRRILVSTSAWVEIQSDGLGEMHHGETAVSMSFCKPIGKFGLNFKYSARPLVHKPEQITAALDAHILDVISGYDTASCEVFTMPTGWKPSSLILDLSDVKQVPLSEPDRKRLDALLPKKRSQPMTPDNTHDEIDKGAWWVAQGPCMVDNQVVLGVGHLGTKGMVWPETSVKM